MTDDRMDALLHEVGSRWRENQPGAVDVPLPMSEPRRGRPRWPLLVSAAAVAAALVAGLVITIAGLGGDDTNPVPAAGLANTVWRLMDDGRPAQSGGTLYVVADGTMVADDVCAVVGAKLDAEDGKLYPTGSLPVRTRPCTARTGPQLGDTFVDLLTEFPDYAVDGDHLTIGAGAAQLRFVADPALPRPTIDVPSIDEARWRLTGVDNSAGTQLPVPKGVNFRISNGELQTSDGCNDISSDAAVADNGTLDLKGFSATEVGCVDVASAAVIDQMFSGSVRQRVTGNTLTLTRSGVGTLTYTWVPDDTTATDPTRLVGPDFRLVSVGGQPADGPFSISFRDGRFSDGDGCNATSGAAVLEPGVLRLTDGASTAMSCPRVVSSDQHDAVDQVLFAKSAFWTLQDRKLVVRGNGAQSSALVFAGAGAAPPQPEPSLVGTWTLSEVATDNGNSGSGTGGSDLGVTVTFDNGRYRTTGLCGGQQGTYALSGNELRVRTGGEDLCLAGGAGRYVQPLLTGGTTSRFSVSGSELTLVHDKVTATFTKK